MTVNQPLINKSETAIKEIQPHIDSTYHDIVALKEELFDFNAQEQPIKMESGSSKLKVIIENIQPQLKTKNQEIQNLPLQRQQELIPDLQEELNELANGWKTYAQVHQKATETNFKPRPEQKPLKTLENLTIETSDKIIGQEDYLKAYSKLVFKKHQGQPLELNQNQIQKRSQWYPSQSDTLPLIEGLQKTKERINEVRKYAFSNLDGTTDYQPNTNTEYQRPFISALQPESWNNLSAFYTGDLHQWLEREEPSQKQSVQHEYQLHFLEPCENHHRRADQPDALEELFVHEFKQPENRITPTKLDENGPITISEEEDLKQVNKYLDKLDLPAGLLIYGTRERKPIQYVVERSESEIPPTENIYKRENYNFNKKISKLM